MFFPRILLLSLVLPQLALGQVAVKPNVAITDADVQLLNRAARAELRGYAIQQEMLTLGESFAMDPGYEWDAESLANSFLTPAQRTTKAAFYEASAAVAIIGTAVFTVASLAPVLLTKYMTVGKGGWSVARGFQWIGVLGIFWGLISFPTIILDRDADSAVSQLNWARSILRIQSLQDDLADSRTRLIEALFRISKEGQRTLRDTFIAEFSRRGNVELNAAVLRKSAVLTEAQIIIFEKFQKDTSASLTQALLVPEMSAKNLTIDAISHLQGLRDELGARIDMLATLTGLPTKTPGGMTVSQLQAKHVAWSNEIDAVIKGLNLRLALVSDFQ